MIITLMEKICFKLHYCSFTTLMFASFFVMAFNSIFIITNYRRCITKPNLGVTPILPIKPKPFMPSGMGMDSNTHNIFMRSKMTLLKNSQLMESLSRVGADLVHLMVNLVIQTMLQFILRVTYL
jgi:hypothetical protein